MPNLTEAQKFIHLKGYLQGGALNLVENIPVTDSGYSSAFKQLGFNFLDVENIIDKVLDKILVKGEVKLLLDVEPLIRTLNIKIQDLRGLNVNLIEEGSVSLFFFFLLLSKIVNKKLNRVFN